MKAKKLQKVTTGKKENMIKALNNTFGNVSEAIRQLEAQGLSVSRQSHYRWLEDEDYKIAIDNAADKTLDKVEKALQTQIEKGSVQATMFYLKTKGRNRGYNEKLDVDITSGEEPIQIHIDIK